MNKLVMNILMVLCLVVSVSSSVINTFQVGETALNLTFSAKGNHTVFINLTGSDFVKVATLSITGYPLGDSNSDSKINEDVFSPETVGGENITFGFDDNMSTKITKVVGILIYANYTVPNYWNSNLTLSWGMNTYLYPGGWRRVRMWCLNTSSVWDLVYLMGASYDRGGEDCYDGTASQDQPYSHYCSIPSSCANNNLLQIKVGNHHSGVDDRDDEIDIMEINVSVLDALYPINITIDTLSDSIVDYNYTNELNNSVDNIDLNATTINNYISSSCSINQQCLIPIEINSSTIGTVQISNINFTINDIPTLNLSILNKPLTSVDDIVAQIDYGDTDGDTWTYNETKWFNNSIEFIALTNLTTVGSGNTSDNETWIVMARVYDGFQWSEWVNDSVVIADSTPPTINSISVNSLSLTTAQSLIITANVTDELSAVLSSACKFEMFKSDLTPDLFNLTSNTISGDLISKTQALVTYGTGTLEFRKAYCSDASANQAVNTSVGINITISAPTVPLGGSGGGDNTAFNCKLNLQIPIAGTLFDMFGTIGSKTQTGTFVIKNTGTQAGYYTFEVNKNDYLKENCVLGTADATIEANIGLKNTIQCTVPKTPEIGIIKISGCGEEQNYNLRVSQGWIQATFEAVVNGLPVNMFGTQVPSLIAVFIFVFGFLVIVILATFSGRALIGSFKS